jgi:hypothetical protein
MAAAGAGAKNSFGTLHLYNITKNYGRIDTSTQFISNYRQLSFKKGKYSYIIKSPIGLETELIFVNSKDIPESLMAEQDDYTNTGKSKPIRRLKDGHLTSNPSYEFMQLYPISGMYNTSKGIGEQREDFYRYSQSPDTSSRYLIAIYINKQESQSPYGDWSRSGNFIFIDNHGQEYHTVSYQMSHSMGGGGGGGQPRFSYLFFNDDLYPKQLPDIQIDFIKSTYRGGELILSTPFTPISLSSFLKMINNIPSLCQINTEPSREVITEPSKTLAITTLSNNSSLEPSKILTLAETEPSRRISNRKNNRHSLINSSVRNNRTIKNVLNKLKNRLGSKSKK